jgi:hypothetical protein
LSYKIEKSETKEDMKERVENEEIYHFNTEKEQSDKNDKEALDEFSMDDIPINITINSMPEFN